MKYHFKVRFGYGDRDFFLLSTPEELEKAIYAFMYDKKVFLKGGALDGKSIMSIKPDINTTMGWTYNYKPTPEQALEARATGLEEKMEAWFDEAKTHVTKLVSTGNTELIGKTDEEAAKIQSVPKPTLRPQNASHNILPR